MKKDKRPSIRWSEHEIELVDAKRGSVPFGKFVREAAINAPSSDPVAGEELKKGDSVYIGEDGKVYKSI